jgi:putative ABC transport system substrate-binding protein
LTVWLPRRGVTLQRIVRLGLACACLALVSAQAVAARVTVVLSDDSAPYQEVYQVIRAYLDDTAHEVVRVYAGELTGTSVNGARLAVAVGVLAAESLAALPARPPVLAVLVPRAWYIKSGRVRLGDGGRRSASAIYLDQPFERQAQLIRLAFPEVRRVGVLVGAEQRSLVGELDEALRTQQLGLVHQILAADERLITPLENVLSGAELLLAVPDPLVFNRNTAQSLFLTSYRYRVPVLGYSRSLTRAGALLSLHSSPAQIGRQTAEWVNGAIQGVPVNLPPPAYPAYFNVSINQQVARSLGFTLLPETELEQRLGGGR